MKAASKQQEINSLPSIYRFADYRDYLKSFYEHTKKHSPSYSLSYLSRRTGNLLSKGYLSLLIQKKRDIHETKAAPLAKGLGLKGKELRYFETLIRFTKAKSSSTKEHYLKELSGLRPKTNQDSLGLKDYSLIRNWHALIIRELSRLPDFSPNPENISIRLRKLLTVSEAREALKALELSDLDNKSGVIRTSDEVRSIGIQSYHRSCLDLGKRMLETLPLQEREFASINLAINEPAMSRIKEKIKQFREELIEIASEIEGGDRVSQVNIQFFQVTTNN